MSSVTFEVPSAVSALPERTAHSGVSRESAFPGIVCSASLLQHSAPGLGTPFSRLRHHTPHVFVFLGKQGRAIPEAAKLRAPDPWSSIYQRLGRGAITDLVLAAHLALAQPGPIKVTPILNWVVRVVSPSPALQGAGQHLFSLRLLSWGGCTSSSICFISSSTPNAPERIQPCLHPSLQVQEDVRKPAREGPEAPGSAVAFASLSCLPHPPGASDVLSSL